MTLWVDGAVVADPATPVVRADDHGLVVGDGAFETVEVRDRTPFALTRHLRRLGASARGLGIDVDEELIRRGVAEVLAADAAAGVLDRARLRITVTGGPSPYGSDRGAAPPTLLVATAPLPDWPPTTDVWIVPWVRNERAATAGLKTISYADNVVALRYAHDRGAAEAVFANTRGEVCEGTGSNVFFEYDGALVTPPLDSGCLAGITRELLVEWLRADGVPVHELALPIDALRRAREAFITSTTRSVLPVRAVDAVPLAEAPGALTRRARDVFAARAAADLDP
jgi:branched-chain amino acid aminotransferase